MENILTVEISGEGNLLFEITIEDDYIVIFMYPGSTLRLFQEGVELGKERVMPNFP